jgi:hypothetical protein
MPRSRNKVPFLIDEDGHSFSRTDFRRMRKDAKREMMINWFNQNYEDPAQNTSYVSAEGGYLWDHGGPYDAREELYAKFEGLVSEQLLEEIAEQVELGEITEWAGVDQPEDWEDIDGDEPPSLDNFPDEPGPNYGSPQELEARAKARNAAAELEAYLTTPSAGIGHNNPPSQIEVLEVEEIREAAANLNAEFGKQKPKIRTVKKWGRTIRNAVIRVGGWTAALIATIALTAILTPLLTRLLDALLNWMGLATQIPL